MKIMLIFILSNYIFRIEVTYMSAWNQFEIDSTNYLNNLFGQYATFTHHGGSDSTISDIYVETKSGKTFYIDAKHCPAQCGQFVLLPNIQTQKFEYSKQNINPLNPYAEQIITHMNNNFEVFKEAGTAGKTIEIDSNIFVNWIKSAYKHKKTYLFITNNFALIPINAFEKYFYVTAKYRIKRSGSSSVGKTHISEVKAYIDNNYKIKDFLINGSKLFVSSKQNLHNSRFILNGYEYMFSLRDNEYEIRKLSNTYNANVIFSIDIKSDIKGLSNDKFISFLLK